MKNAQSQDSKMLLINRARQVLNGQFLDRDAIADLLKDLEKWDQFGYASEILQRKIDIDKAKGMDIQLKRYHTLVKYIYKDQSLPSVFKFDKALKVLESNDNLSRSIRCETLGFAGAIYKRMWQNDHQFKNLILSQHYYKRGYDTWAKFMAGSKMPASLASDSDQNDVGYTAINYAYVSELMAVDKLEEHGLVTGITPGIEVNFKEAEKARAIIRDSLTAFENTGEFKKRVNKWIYPTIAEACFGLRQYDLAALYIQKYMAISENGGASESSAEKAERIAWEVRTFRQQLMSIAYLQIFQKEAFTKNAAITSLNEEKYVLIAKEIDLGKINECLNIFRNPKSATDRKIKKDGKLGLALSGGGFRASLFHIGALAALAEADKLKDVEVLSCVSGGSIIGAYYYLKLRELLQTKTDSEIKREDYIALVKEMESDFLEGVQKNLRIMILNDPWKNLLMLFTKKYSRTHRIGELYEKYFYNDLVFGKTKERSVFDVVTGDPENNQPVDSAETENSAHGKSVKKKGIFMDEILIRPAGDDSFNLAIDNWDRINKVPQLVLNSTCINTGHNWQFTSSWMGEPPGAIQTEIDVKPRLRRMYYEDAPRAYKKFPLGYAVGASSCVPVLFPPLLLPDLYPGVDLQLVDGGLHDNQGIGALIEQECNNMIISDASGQMPTNNTATNGMTSVFFRADMILQERLRELQFKDIEERSHTTQVRDLIKIHLKDGLQSKPVSWKHCQDPPRRIMYDATEKDESGLTEYGILINVQQALSEIRTDLDSFHDTEAYALMYSGYKQTQFKLEQDSRQVSKAYSASREWDFLKVEKSMTDPEEAEETIKKLKLGKNVFLKAFDLIGPGKYTKPVILLTLIVGVLYLGYELNKRYVFNVDCFQCLLGYAVIVPAMLFVLFTLLYWLYIGLLAPVYNKYGRVAK